MTKIEEKREIAYQTIAKFLEANKMDGHVHPICPGDGKKPLCCTDRIENIITPGTIDIWGQNVDGKLETIYGNLTKIANRLRENAGIECRVMDCRKAEEGEIIRLLIDTNQPDFDDKLQALFNKSKGKLVARAEAAHEERIKNIVEDIRGGIPLDLEGKPVSNEQAATLIAQQVEALKILAKELGVGNIVDAILSPRTGRSTAKN